jgi:hypothetical protein
LLKFIFQRDAFIIDIKYLEKLLNFRKLTDNIRFNIDYFTKLTDTSTKLHLTFGIFDEYVDSFDTNVSI